MRAQHLDIYFTSDIHGYIYPTSYRSQQQEDIGLFKCVNHFHKNGNSLIIDGGDILQGSAFGAYCHDTLGTARPLAEIMNLCGYDYITLGNHDFNFGMDYLTKYISNLNAFCVCQNITDRAGTLLFPCRIHTLESGLRVGIVGIVTDHVNLWEKPKNIENIQIIDPFEAAQRALEELRGKVDLTICIYHGGFERNLETGHILSTSTENIAYRICEELDFDILLTGHQHLSIQGQLIHGTYVVQPMDQGREYHHIHVVVEEGHVICTSERGQAGGVCSPELLDRFASIEAGTQEWLDQEAGRLPHPFLPAAPLIMAAEGNEIANLFNQIQLEYSGAQISAVSLANEVAGFPQTVRRRDILTTYPYTNSLVVLDITGKVLRQAIERSAEYFTIDEQGRLAVSDRFLRPKVEHYNYDYFAGVKYTIDVSRPIGNRVTNLTYQGTPVQEKSHFTICINNYRASGAGGYPFYQECPVVYELNREMSELILEYFENRDIVLPAEGSEYSVIW